MMKINIFLKYFWKNICTSTKKIQEIALLQKDSNVQYKIIMKKTMIKNQNIRKLQQNLSEDEIELK